jgi:6-phosphofructokinase 1
MGRDAGFIALRSGIAVGAEAVLVPEKITDIGGVKKMLTYGEKHGKRSNIIIVAEGDDGGGAFEVASRLKKMTKKYDIRVSVLGHVQRGGAPSCMDRVLASRLGVAAVNALVAGKRNIMVGTRHKDICHTPFPKAIKHHKELNKHLLEIIEILTL